MTTEHRILGLIVVLLVLLLMPLEFTGGASMTRLQGDVYGVGVEQSSFMPIGVYYGSKAMEHLRQPENTVERESLEKQQQYAYKLANIDKPFYSVEPSSAAVGCSSGLAYFMAYDGYPGRAAATGCLTSEGKVLAVDLAYDKYKAAQACECVDIFYIPIANMPGFIIAASVTDYDKLPYAFVTYTHDVYDVNSPTRVNNHAEFLEYENNGWDKQWREKMKEAK